MNVKVGEEESMKCPKCDFEQPDTSQECPRCGVIFRKVKQSPASQGDENERTSASHSQRVTFPGEAVDRQSVAGGLHVGYPGDRFREQQPEIAATDDSESESAPEARRMEREDWLFLAGGLAVTVLVLVVPLFNHIFRTLMTLVHEMGHMIFGWLFGYPSVPAFDLMYGGGVTVHTARSILLLLVIYVLFGFAIFSLRKNITAVVILATLALIHLIFTLTTLHDLTVLFMGHGTELVIAGIFFYRALSGSAVIHSAERPLYAAIAFFIVFSDVSFAYGLMTSPFARAEYGDAKGGGHWMDFSRIAEDNLHVSLAGVAGFFLLCCLATLPIGFLAFRYQEYLLTGLKRLLAR